MNWEPIADATGTIAGSVWPLVIFATALLSARIYCRMTEGLRLWWDDGLLVLGCAFLIAGTGCLTHALRLGHLSSDGSSSDPDLMTLLMPLAHSCHLLSLLLSKISFGMTLLRFSQKAQKVIIWIIIGTISISLPVHAVLVWHPICGNPSPYSMPRLSCWDQSKTVYMNITTSSLSALTDFILAFLPWRVVLSLHMDKIEKIKVGIAMSFGVIAGIIAIVKISQSTFMLDPTNPGFMKTIMLFWTFSFAEPATTIMAASVPVIRVLFRNVARTGGYSKNSSSKNADPNLQKAGTQTPSQVLGNIQDPNDPYHEGNEDAGSDRSILGAQKHLRSGIVRTTEVSIEYGREGRDTMQAGNGGSGESYELSSRPIKKRSEHSEF